MFKKWYYAAIVIIAILFVVNNSIRPIYHTQINEKLFEDYLRNLPIDALEL